MAACRLCALKLPAIVTADLRLNEPRYASLPNIMKAKKKPLDMSSPADLGVDTAARVTLLGVELPAERQAGIVVEDVAQLMDKLEKRSEGDLMSILVIAEHDNSSLKRCHS